MALTHIIKYKAEPTTPRIKRLLEHISSYSFTLYYIKGNDMILSDFLSRQDCEGTEWLMDTEWMVMMLILFLMILCFVPRQLRFALYSRAVITGGLMQL